MPTDSADLTLLTLTMANTAVLLIDPYNDFLHEKGKAYPSLAESLKDTNTIAHLKELVKTARAAEIPIFYCLHQQITQYTYQNWQRLNKSQTRLLSGKIFEEGTFGAEIYEGLEPDMESGDVLVLSVLFISSRKALRAPSYRKRLCVGVLFARHD